MMIFSLRFRGPEEADDAMCVKSISSSTQASFCQPCFLRSFSRRKPVKDNRANPFIQTLLWCPTPLLNQMIVVGSLSPLSLGLWHDCLSSWRQRSRDLRASFAITTLLAAMLLDTYHQS